MSHPHPSARTRNILVLFLVALLFAVPFSGGFVADPVRAAQASPSDEFASAQPVRASAPIAPCQLAWEVASSPDVGALYAVTAISANDVWAGGEEGFLHWDGEVWNIVPKPSPTTIYGMSAISTNDVWAVSYSAILHWDGLSWSIAALVPGAFLYDVAAISTNDVWIVGSNIVHWNGKQWETFTIPRDYYLA